MHLNLSRIGRRKRDLLFSFFCFSLFTPAHKIWRKRVPFGFLSTVVCDSSAQPSFHARGTSRNNNVMISSNEPSSNVGGGAVNEKKRLYPERLDQTQCDDRSGDFSSSYDPIQHRSHLLHAMEGLDRYPNYLSRWREEDMDLLEHALNDRLNQVRDQRIKVIQQRKEMQVVLQDFLEANPEWKDFVQVPSSWKEVETVILDPRAAKAILRSKMFRQSNDRGDTISLDDVLSGRIQVELDTAYLQEWMDEEMFDVYSFPILSSSFCHKLHKFVSAFVSALELSPSFQTLTRGIHKDLDNMGMGWLNDLLFQLVTRPIAAQLYKETDLAGGDLDWKQGFIASYSAEPTQSKPRQRLVSHTDDAEVSINCQGKRF